MTEENSLLAAVALRLARSPEDVATEGLAYVLARSECARALVGRLARDWASGSLRPMVSFHSQVGRGDDSRPDLEGHDSAGIPVVIFENQFWAGLTDVQPVSYLRRLEEKGGVLCFVTPASRLRFLWPELIGRAADAYDDVRSVRCASELRLARVGKNRVLALTSWAFFLGQLRVALEAQGDSSLVADVRQLTGLAARMETCGFVPLTVADLTAPTARHVMQFCEIVNVLVEELLREPFVSKKGLKASSGQGWSGHYLSIHGYGCNLSFNAPKWAEHGLSPVWLCIASRDWNYPEPVERAMTEYLGSDAYVAVRDHGWEGVWVPQRIPEGRELHAVVEDMRKEVLKIAHVLSDLGSREEKDATPITTEAD